MFDKNETFLVTWLNRFTDIDTVTTIAQCPPVSADVLEDDHATCLLHCQWCSGTGPCHTGGAAL